MTGALRQPESRFPTETAHIVHVAGTLQAGGVQRLILGLAHSEALTRYRHSVVCVFGARGELSADFAAARIVATSCPLPWPDTLPIPSHRINRWIRHRLIFTFPWRLRVLLRRMRADLVHSHLSDGIELQTDGVVRRAHVPLVWTIHGLYGPTGGTLSAWRRALQLGRAGRFHVTADSGPVADDFVARGLGPRSSVTVVNAGADVSHFRVARPRDPAWRVRWNIPEDAFVFGTAGRLVPAKAHDVLIAAAARLIREGRTPHVAIAGNGPLEHELKENIIRTGLGAHVHMLGFQADVRSFLAELDVFVLPSRSEGFPLALIEALAAGVPCVATRVGGVGEMLGEDGGLTVDAESPEQLADAMRLLMLDGERCARYRAAGRAIAERFSYDVAGSGFDRIYAQLLRR